MTSTRPSRLRLTIAALLRPLAAATLGLPLRRGVGLNRQGMDFTAHACAEARIDELVALDQALALEQLRHDQCLEVSPVAADLEMLAVETVGDELAEILGIDHGEIRAAR